MSEAMLEALGAQLAKPVSASALARWQPALSGKMPLVIRADGSWWHDGGLIRRESLVRLLASVLRCESDGLHYLVTPQEKWQIEVEDAAVVLTDVSQRPSEAGSVLVFESALLGLSVPLLRQRQWQTRSQAGSIVPYLRLDNGLSGRVARGAYYRLAQWSESEPSGAFVVRSAGQRIELYPAA